MLDRLLGRADLKDRIAALESERDRLENRLEAESDRRAAAVSEKQAAEERINRLEDRIADLEGQVEQEPADGAADLDYRRTESLRGDRCAAVLDRLRGIGWDAESVLTAAVPSDPSAAPDVARAVRGAFDRHAPLILDRTPCIAVTDDAGLLGVALAPPLPPDPFVSWDGTVRLDDAWFRPAAQDRYAFALVRSDRFALAEYDGATRTSLTTVENDVPQRHGKGGFSQGRFERRRDAALTEHIDECREAIDRRDADRLFLTGERTAIDALDVDAERTVPVDASGDPEDALANAFRTFWTTRLYAV